MPNGKWGCHGHIVSCVCDCLCEFPMKSRNTLGSKFTTSGLLTSKFIFLPFTHTYTYTHTHKYTYTHTQIHIYTHTHACKCMRTHTQNTGILRGDTHYFSEPM